jgi:histidinol-phosphate phosphatase family protein
VLFDRDGTLVVDVPYNADPEQVRLVPDAREAVDRVRSAGLGIGVVSNQSGVAKGLITPEQLDRVNARVRELLGTFDTWQSCLHDAGQGCGCRKPAPGLVLAAAAELGVDPAGCVVIGDIGADVGAALAAGARAVLVPTATTRSEEVAAARRTAAVAPTLLAAVELVLADDLEPGPQPDRADVVG